MRYPVCCSARNFAVVNTMNRKRFGILIFTIFCGTDLLANPVTAACSADNWKIGEPYNYTSRYMSYVDK